MKALSLAVLSLVIFSSVSANAYFRPGWERPIASAGLRQTDANGHSVFNGVTTSLTLHHADGAAADTTFSLTTQGVRYCVTTPCPQPAPEVRSFRIQRSHIIGAGMVEYIAVEQNTGRLLLNAKLQVIDNKARNVWNITLTEKRHGGGVRYYEGNYEGVITPQ